MTGETFDNLPALAHVADIIDDGKRAAAMQIAVKMRCIRSKHHGPACRLDPHNLQAVGMAADPMHGDAGCNHTSAGMKRDTLAVDVAHHQCDVFNRKWMTQVPKAHATPRGIAHFAVLKVKSRIRKQVEVAGVADSHARPDNA